MDRIGFDLNFDIHGPDDDGVLVALCQQLPMIIAANGEADLRLKVVAALDSLPVMLDRIGESQGVHFLETEGVPLSYLEKGESPGTRTITLPVLLSA